MSFDGMTTKNFVLGYHKPKNDIILGGIFGVGREQSAAPAAPVGDDGSEARRKRDEAEAAALAEQKSSGRRAFVSGGAADALAERQANPKSRFLG